jgi:hypothetical protein
MNFSDSLSTNNEDYKLIDKTKVLLNGSNAVVTTSPN